MTEDDKTAALNAATLSERLHYLKGRNEALAEVAGLFSADQDALLVSLAALAKADPGLASLGLLLERLADQREILARRLVDLRDEAAIEARLIQREVLQHLGKLD